MSLALRLSVLRKNLALLDPAALEESRETLTEAIEALGSAPKMGVPDQEERVAKWFKEEVTKYSGAFAEGRRDEIPEAAIQAAARVVARFARPDPQQVMAEDEEEATEILKAAIPLLFPPPQSQEREAKADKVREILSAALSGTVERYRYEGEDGFLYVRWGLVGKDIRVAILSEEGIE